MLIGNTLLGIRVTNVSLANAISVHCQTVAEHAAKLEAALLGSQNQTGDFDRVFTRIDVLPHSAGILSEQALTHCSEPRNRRTFAIPPALAHEGNRELRVLVHS